MSRLASPSHIWDSRVASWSDQVRTDPAFRRIRDDVNAAAPPHPTDVVVDLGAGAGLLALQFATVAAHVTAVDIAPKMLDSLAAAARRQGSGNVSTVVTDLSNFDLAPSSVDLVVSSYALHHLPDAEKHALLQRVYTWLRPGGRLVIADMMFGRGTTSADRVIIRGKLASLAARGPAGWWRIAKNVVRFGLRLGSERPATPTFWCKSAHNAGFANISYRPIVAEAGMLVADVSGRQSSPRPQTKRAAS
jgi:ubiquinone/menaquinone biosynthesis C-methylase UbiE